MRMFKAMQLVAVGLVCLLPAGASAQVKFDAPGLLIKKPKPGPPAPKAAPEVWPRLDPGAVLCRTEADLMRLAANRHGGPGGGAADCRLISRPTPIQIVERKGPGRTEVRVTGGTGGKAGQTGWTDVWLPVQPPRSPLQ